MDYTTKATPLGNGMYGCRVYYNDKLVVEARVSSRSLIGPAFRDLLRTLDKLGGTLFTSAARKRKYRDRNECLSVKHRWAR